MSWKPIGVVTLSTDYGLVETYAGASPGELAALVSSYELLEIAARDASAKDALAEVASGTRVVLRRRRA